MKKYLLRLMTTYGVHAFYWRIRSLYRGVRFSLANSGFKVRYSFSNISSDINIISSIFLSVLRTIISAIVFSAGILLLGSLGKTLATYVSLPSWITFFFTDVTSDNRSSYDGLLIGVITIIGIFLTLYLTSVNTVAGTLYAKVPKQIRDLLVQERVGNVYIRYLIFLTIVCLCLLIAGVIWSFRPIPTILIVALMGCYAVVAFAQLAWRIFLFFDPTSLADILLWELGRWSNQATTKGYAWDDPSFQTHYRRRATESLSGIKALVTIAHEESYLRREALSTLLGKLSTMIPIYLQRKWTIPPDSRWWNTVPEHKDGYLTDSSEVSMAASTRTTLQATMKPDTRWLEKEIVGIHIEALDACIKDGRTNVVFRILDDQRNIFHTLGSNWDVEYGEQVLSKITQIVSVFLSQPAVTNEPRVGSDSLIAEQIQMVEFLGLFPISLMLGLVQSVESLDVTAFAHSITRTKWQRNDAPYRLGLPPIVLERAEFVHRGLLFERRVEGTVISAEWYIRLLIYQSLAEALWAQINGILKLGKDHYLSRATQWIAEDKTLLAAHTLSRGLEFYNKLLHHLPTFHKLATGLEEANIHTMLGWPKWNWEDIAKQVHAAQKDLSKCLATCIPELAATTDVSNLLDYFGQAVHTAGDECFTALLDNDAETFATIFPYYFVGGLSMHDRVREKTKGWNTTGAISASSEPLIDMCELSGYAFFFSELHQNPTFWETCKTRWDKYFTQDNAREKMEIWALFIEGKQNFTLMAHRAILRTQWEMAVNDVLRSLPRKPIHLNGRSFIERYVTVLDHQSPLVRVFGGTDDHYMSFYHGIDIFVELYLEQRPETDGLDFGRNRELADMIERHRKFDEKQAKADDGAIESEGDEDADDLFL